MNLNGAIEKTQKTVRAMCRPCGLDISIQTLNELHIERFADGGGALLDVSGRALCCVFCRAPLDGALYRKRN